MQPHDGQWTTEPLSANGARMVHRVLREHVGLQVLVQAVNEPGGVHVPSDNVTLMVLHMPGLLATFQALDCAVAKLKGFARKISIQIGAQSVEQRII